MRILIISGHGKFASGIKSTIELILGKQENMHFIDFLETDTPKDLAAKLDNVIKKYNSHEEFVIFTDLVGGTPFTTSVQLKEQYKNLNVFTGTNIPMVVQAIQEDSSDEEFEKSILRVAKDSCMKYEFIEFDETVNKNGV